MDRIRHQRDAFERLLFGRLTNAFAIATESERLPGTSSIYIGGVPADALIARMPLVCIGAGSACTSGALSPSHVLLACGLSREDARCVIRVSIGRFTSEHDLQFAIDRIVENVNAIRSYSGVSSRPVWKCSDGIQGMTLNEFLEQLPNLSGLGNGFKPHKHLALLAVIQLIKSGSITSHDVLFNDDFRVAFTDLLKTFGGESDRNRPYNPFFHLRSHPFWKLVPKPGTGGCT